MKRWTKVLRRDLGCGRSSKDMGSLSQILTYAKDSFFKNTRKKQTQKYFTNFTKLIKQKFMLAAKPHFT